MDARQVLGRRGERVAEEMYRRMGYRVVARNVRTRRGEIDLICRTGSLIVFCEVKTRRGTRFGPPAEAVDERKALRIRGLALDWMRSEGFRGKARFDVVSVMFRGSRPEVKHIPGAF